LATAAVLIEAGDADRIVVVAVDDVGAVTRALWGDALQHGAVALLLSAERTAAARARVGEVRLSRRAPTGGLQGPRPSARVGHGALLPLVEGAVPRVVEGGSPPDSVARVTFEPL
jgi:hypothetical protein